MPSFPEFKDCTSHISAVNDPVVFFPLKAKYSIAKSL